VGSTIVTHLDDTSLGDGENGSHKWWWNLGEADYGWSLWQGYLSRDVSEREERRGWCIATENLGVL